MGENGDEWDFQRIGTTSEKSSVEKELAELRERLEKVEEWKKRRQQIDEELGQVWLSGGEQLAPPPYQEKEGESTVDLGRERDDVAVESEPEPERR